MITTSQFSFTHNSFWTGSFPALENYVRAVNAGGYERSFKEMAWPVDPGRSALVSEVAFCLCRSPNLTIAEGFSEAENRLALLPGVPTQSSPLTKVEGECAKDLANRISTIIRQIVGRKSTNLTFDPLFVGCGLLDHSRGDIAAGDTLIEIKSVDRSFRSSDFRQVMTYVLQDWSSGSSKIQNIAVLNARRGTYTLSSVRDFVFDVSATTFSEIQNAFLAAVGSNGASR